MERGWGGRSGLCQVHAIDFEAPAHSSSCGLRYLLAQRIGQPFQAVQPVGSLEGLRQRRERLSYVLVWDLNLALGLAQRIERVIPTP
jgi:hypothetical protein